MLLYLIIFLLYHLHRLVQLSYIAEILMREKTNYASESAHLALKGPTAFRLTTHANMPRHRKIMGCIR